MIINIRGPGGAGKSTLVRQVMALGNRVMTRRTPDRKQPLGYLYSIPFSESFIACHQNLAGCTVPLAIPGHYESRCGGCDTINNYELLFGLVRDSSKGFNVLYEGLLISEDVPRTLNLVAEVREWSDVHVIALDTPLDVCLASINARREEVFQERLGKAQDENILRLAKGLKPKPLPESRGLVDTKKTTDKWHGLRRSMKKIERVRGPEHARLHLHWRDRQGAFSLIRELLGV